MSLESMLKLVDFKLYAMINNYAEVKPVLEIELLTRNCSLIASLSSL